MLRKLLLSSAIVAVSSTFAFAADPVDPVVDDIPYDWSGLYIGVHAGYADGDYTLFSASGRGPGVDVNGFAGGATIGYNWHVNQWVFGVEADISSGPDGTTAVGTVGPFWSCITGACNADIEYFGTLRARLGIANNNWLFYGTGGFAWGSVDGGIFNSAQQGGGNASGWAAGGGIEYAFNQNWTTKFEILHVDLGDIPFGVDDILNTPFEGDGDFNVFRFGINYKF